MSGQSTTQLGKSPRAVLVTLSESDFAEVVQFIAVQSGKQPAAVERHLRWFLLDNPTRLSQVPLGCGLRSPQGRLVGCILYAPQAFHFQQQRMSILGSSSFYVDQLYRGSGGLLFLRFSELNRNYAMFANSANADSAKLWKARGAVPIRYSDHELLGILNWKGLIEEGLHRRITHKMPAIAQWARIVSHPAAVLAAPFKRMNLPAGDAVELVPLTSAEQVMQLPIHNPTTQLTAARDLPYIQWRYFSGIDATTSVFAFYSPEIESKVMVAVNQRPRGFRGQICVLHVLDIYPQMPPNALIAIVCALVKRYRGSIDMIVLRGLNETQQAAFQGLGFLRRQFEAPNGWLLDKSVHLPTQDWRFVPADGDWLI